jgi:hypothetical protein
MRPVLIINTLVKHEEEEFLSYAHSYFRLFAVFAEGRNSDNESTLKITEFK